MEKFIMAGGCAVRVSDKYKKERGGENQTELPVIVLLHGYLESMDIWDDFSNLLIPAMRVIAIDLPGHGISEVKGEIHTMEFLADTVKAVLDELGIRKYFLTGHSMGGYAALEFLRKYPDKLSGFILFHSTPDPDTEEKKANRQREINIIDSGKKELLMSTAGNGFAADNRKKFADDIEDLKELIVLTDDEGIKALLRGMMERRDSNDVLKESDVPELLIFGRKDEYIPLETAEKIIAGHPQAKVMWLENSGHMGFIEEPQTAADAILGFCLGKNKVMTDTVDGSFKA